MIETTIYTQSQLVIMAIEAPRLRDLLELISEGYKKGMASQDNPYGVGQSKHAYRTTEPAHIEEVVEEDEPYCYSVGNVGPNTQPDSCHSEAHRTSCRSEKHQLVATNSFDYKVCHRGPEHPLHRIASGENE